MKINRVISVALCFVLLLCVSGCGDTQKTAMLTENDIIGQDGCFLYTIVSASGNSQIENADKEAKNLKKQIGEAFDIKVNTSSDDKIKSNSETYEILIGNTNREESKQALEILKEKRIQNIDDWMIKVIDNKICIVSVSDENLAKAIRHFNVNYCTKLADFSKLVSDFEFVDAKIYEVSNANEEKIGTNYIGNYVIVTAREKSYLFNKKLSEFANIFKEKHGIEIKQVRDTETKESQYEIVVGTTNRAVRTNKKPTGDKYVIELIGNKLVINGGNDFAIAAGVQRILDMELEARESKKPFVIPENFKEEATAKLKKDEYQLKWSDEFNGKLDKTVWSKPMGDPSKNPSPNGGTTYGRGIETVFTRDGKLVLPGKRLNDVDFESSGIVSSNAFAFRYGVLEIRAKLAPPPMFSTIWGYKPALQMKNGKRVVGTDIKNAFELDVLENFGQPDWFASNVHQWWNDGSKHTSLDGTKYAELKKYTFPEGKAFYDEFHIFTFEWTPYEMVFSVDGEAYFHYDMSTIKNVGFAQTPIDLRFSGGFSTAAYHLSKKIPDDAPKYGEYLIDYVRVYQSEQYDNILWYDPIK